MSRIGKQPITVPSGVDVTIAGAHVTVKGPKGQLEHEIVGGVTVEREGDTLVVTPRRRLAVEPVVARLQRSLINNMVVGVSDGFAKELEIVGVGYRAAAQGSDAHRARARLLAPGTGRRHPSGITFEVPQPTRIIVRGFDKQLVGQVAADIRKIRKPEPYKGKGVRYAGERIVRKAGKSAK